MVARCAPVVGCALMAGALSAGAAPVFRGWLPLRRKITAAAMAAPRQG
jgi:hypothetical protein